MGHLLVDIKAKHIYFLVSFEIILRDGISWTSITFTLIICR